MPDQIQPSPEYHDDSVVLSVEPPTGSRPTIRLSAVVTGVGAVVDLSALGAQRLSSLLAAAVTSAITRGMPTDQDGDR